MLPLNTYEGLFIFADTLKDDELKAVQDRALAEVERQDGKVIGVKKIGRRTFARPMGKRTAGIYVRAVFELDGEKVSSLLARYKLNNDVFRVQITRGDVKSADLVAAAPKATTDTADEPAASVEADKEA